MNATKQAECKCEGPMMCDICTPLKIVKAADGTEYITKGQHG